MGTYDVAQICTNGHAITDRLRTAPARSKPFCPDCGAPTISACPECSVAIQGDYDVPGVFVLGGVYQPPKFCFGCGTPFPWTAERLKSGRELADEIEGLEPAERERLKTELGEITHDGPKTEVAASRVRKILDKVKGPSGQALQKVVTEIATDAAKKILFGA
jgi:hypothetical protein